VHAAAGPDAEPAGQASPDAEPAGPAGRERGSAVVDFVLVGSLLTLFFLAIVQLALVLHVRNTLIDAAASGARYGTLADRGADDARERTRQLIGVALTPEFAREVNTTETTYGGIRTLEVTVRAPLPVIGLIGPRELLEVKGHAAIQP
jgi:TadE-like protein